MFGRNKHLKFHCDEDRIIFEVVEAEIEKAYGFKERKYLKPLVIALYVVAVILFLANLSPLSNQVLLVITFLTLLFWLSDKELEHRRDYHNWELYELLYKLSKNKALKDHIEAELNSGHEDYLRVRFEEACKLGKLSIEKFEKSLRR
jgi:hypothetical protein